MPSFTYVARRPGPFSALVQSAEIGGLDLSPLPPVRAVDRFFDTLDGELLREGLALRVREQDGQRVAGLRLLEGDSTPVDDLYLDPRVDIDRGLTLPVSPLAVAVRDAVGDDPLRPLLTLRQYRTPRIARHGDTSAGVISFDVVVYEVPGGRVVSNEVEVEPDPGGASLAGLDDVFEDRGLEMVSRSKFERAILRTRRTLSEPALLLPDERRRLERAATDQGPVAPIAQAVLLDARGFRPDTISTQTGLGMTRIRQIRERFREVRLDVLAPIPPAAPRRPAPTPAAPRPAAASPDTPPAPPSAAGRADTDRSDDDGPSVEAPESMADLLDQFQREVPDTPHFGEDDADGGDADDIVRSDPSPEPPSPPRPSSPEPTRSPVMRRRYPIVLGPVATLPRPSAFTTVDLGAIEPTRSSETAASPLIAEPSSSLSSAVEADMLRAEIPLLGLAHTVVAQRIETFEATSDRFLDTRAPSDARRLVVAAHGVRLAVETFEAVLPALAGRRLVDALRPLVIDLDAALDYGRAALDGAGTGDVPAFLAQRAAWALDTAAARLRHRRQQAWRDRVGRLLQHMKDDVDDGRFRSDNAPSADEDFVGASGDGPTPSRLSHILGSEVWRRFEVIRSQGDELRSPTPEAARRLAVSLGGLQFTLDLVGRSAPEARQDVRLAADAIQAAERVVTHARQQAISSTLARRSTKMNAMGVVSDVWAALTERPFRSRLASIVEAI